MRGATDLLAEVGLPADEIGVAIVARPPVLATTFPIGARAAAALGACGVAAALLWRDRTGQDQVVEVDARRAEVSLVSFALQRLDGAATPRTAEGRPLVALYETADGRWIHLHGAFPRLAARTVQVIGGDVDADAAEVARRVAGFDALAMEDALAAVGACGAMVRSAEEWAAHPQRAAIAPLGRVSIEKIADGPAVAVGDGLRPLGGVRVLDLTRVLAGPACARLLAEHGADVLHVNGEHLDNVPAFVMDTGHGKRSTSLDLRREADVDLLRGLIGDGDVFSQGYRSGALERRGFGPAQLAELNPGIIAVTINCYGDTGPWRARPGWEQLGQSVTGIAMAEGASLDPAGRPRLVPAAAADYTTGYLAALGTMAALRRRSIEGGAYHVRASLCQTATWIAEDGPCVDPSTATGLGDITPWLVEERTPFGTLTHLTPVAQLAATPARWATPVVPLGTHPPTWPARQTSIVSRVHELCDACGFDGAAFTDSELLESLRGLGTRWRHQLAAAGVHVRTRPTPTTWSAIEYAAHSRDVTALHAYGVEQALTADEPTFRPISDDVADQVADAYGGADPDEVCVELTSAACRLARVAADAGVDAWTRGLTVGETRSDVRRLLEHALHDSQHHLDDVARGVASLSR